MKHVEQPSKETLLPEDWLTLAETLGRLGKSQSTLERLVGSAAIASKLETRAGRKPERLYSAKDVARVAERGGAGNSRTLAVAPASVKKLTADGIPLTATSIDGAITKWVEEQARQREWREAQERERVPLSEKLWLTVAEARTYSGLGAAYLLDLIASKKVVAVKGGPQGSWVIRRQSLAAYSGA